MPDKDWIWIPTRVALRAQRDYTRLKEQRAEARLRYEKRNPERKRAGKGHGDVEYEQKPFVCWDGEGPKDTGYSLFGNSLGDRVCYPGPLKSVDCLDLIIETEKATPDAIHIIFGGNYDVSNILRDMSRRKYNQLVTRGECHWEGYILRHVPGKWFDVKHGHITARVYDVRSFFEGGLVAVLEEWKIGPFAVPGTDTEQAESFVIPTVSELKVMPEAEVVRVFKSLRSEFYWRDIEAIYVYMMLELKYTILLMERVRDILYQAGFTIQSWHGPGAIATKAMQRHGVFSAMAKCPKEVQEAARYAMAGGRFEERLAGHAKGPVWIADLHSAYPYFATKLPNLKRGTWRQGKDFEPGKFAVYWIKYEEPSGSGRFEDISPLFRRMPDGSVHFPPIVEGWYWAPEAELVADCEYAEFLDAWVFDEDDENDRPFTWLNEYYKRKESAKARGDMVAWVWKKIINAVFGQTAKKSGWQRSGHAPRSHQLEWAGYITSGCRAAVYHAARIAGIHLVSIDTDGITSLAPIPGLDYGPGMGQWGLKEYDDGVFWQSGLYMLQTDGEWTKGEAKSRGIPKGTYTADDLITELGKIPERHEDRCLRLSKRQFITYRTALLGRWRELNLWTDEPMKFVFGGQGKRYHQATRCQKRCAPLPGNMHMLIKPMPMTYSSMSGPIMSLPHQLPWLDREGEIRGPFASDEYLVNVNNLEDDMQWVRWYE